MEPAQDNMAESAAAWGTSEIMLIVGLALAVLIAAVVYALKKKNAGRPELRAAPESAAQPEKAPAAASSPAVEPESVSAVSLSSAAEAKLQVEPMTTPIQAETVAAEPEDSVLHRHYEAEQAAKHEAQSNPYPSDSVLRRHYDSAHKLVLEPAPIIDAASSQQAAEPRATLVEKAVAQALAESAPNGATSEATPVAGTHAAVPEDSILHRHYEAEQAAIHEARTNPYPTDSVLRRHYDAAHKLVLEPARPQASSKVAVSDVPAQEVAPTAGAAQQSSAEEITTVRMPQDSVLRRHFISQLKYQIEAELPPIPSDSVLRRHHEALLNAELTKRLSA